MEGQEIKELSPYVLEWTDSPSLLYMLAPLLPEGERDYIIIGMSRNEFSRRLERTREMIEKSLKPEALDGIQERNRKVAEVIEEASKGGLRFFFQTAFVPTGKTTPRAGLWPYSEKNSLTTKELEVYYRVCMLDKYGDLDNAEGLPKLEKIGFIPVAPQLYPFTIGLASERGVRITDMIDKTLVKTLMPASGQFAVESIPSPEMFSEEAVNWGVYRHRKGHPTSRETEDVMPWVHFNEGILATACLPLLETCSANVDRGVIVISKKEGYAYCAVARACKAGGYRFRKDFPLMEGYEKGTLIGEAFDTGMKRLEGHLMTMFKQLLNE